VDKQSKVIRNEKVRFFKEIIKITISPLVALSKQIHIALFKNAENIFR